MNDRFKFRAWFEGRFIYKSLCDSNVYTKDNKCICLANILPDLPWEQCTGLKDKNGKLIYDGDILKNIEQKIKVIFDEQRHCFMFEYQDTKAYKPITCVDVLDDNNLEVIGNIHENPNLLGEDE